MWRVILVFILFLNGCGEITYTDRELFSKFILSPIPPEIEKFEIYADLDREVTVLSYFELDSGVFFRIFDKEEFIAVEPDSVFVESNLGLPKAIFLSQSIGHINQIESPQYFFMNQGGSVHYVIMNKSQTQIHYAVIGY